MANELAGTDHPSPIEVSDTGGLAGLTLWLRAQADGITLTQADSGKLITPADGGGEVTLPASPVAGTTFDFAALPGSPLTVRAQGLHQIFIGEGSGATTTSSAGRLILSYAAPNLWVGLASGAWSLS